MPPSLINGRLCLARAVQKPNRHAAKKLPSWARRVSRETLLGQGSSLEKYKKVTKKAMNRKQSLTSTSRFLSLILRHKPEIIGITLDEHGWADVDALIAGIGETRDFDQKTLEEIVRTDEKQRYAFNEDKTKIRANQGHSIPVDVELTRKTPPDVLYHGTGEKYVSAINERGLMAKSRLYVHLSTDTQTAKKVGSRHGRPVIYSVDCQRMIEDGHDFYLSANGVWLTKAVPAIYIKRLNTSEKK